MLLALRGVNTKNLCKEETFELNETDDLYWMEELDQQDERDWGRNVDSAFLTRIGSVLNCGGKGGKPGPCPVHSTLETSSLPSTKWDAAVKWQTQIDHKDWEAVQAYQGMRAEGINLALRSGKAVPKGSVNTDKTLEKLRDEGHFSLKDTVVVRGVLATKTYSVGEEFTDKSWGSYSLDKDVAIRFAKTGGSGGNIEGVPTVFRVKADRGLLIGGKESEVVLEKGIKYRVAKSSKQGDINVVDLEIVHNAFNPGQQRDAEGRWVGSGAAFSSQANHHLDAPGWQNPPAWKQRKYGGVIVDDQNRFLLREPAGHFDGYRWTFAKGGLDHEAEKPTKAALREVAEETGIKGEILGYVPGEHKIPAQGDYKGSSNYYFLMKSAGASVLPQDMETASTKWASYEDAKKLISQTTNPHGRTRDLNVLEAAYKEIQKRLIQNILNCGGEGGTPGPCPTRLQEGIRQWKGDPSSMQLLIGDIQQGKTPSTVQEERAAALLEQVKNSPLNTKTLYRGDSVHRQGVLEFTESRRVAQGWANRYGGTVKVLPPKTARAFRAEKHDVEKGWIVLVTNEVSMVGNVFCKTGPGGGVDPHCSPGKSEPRGRVGDTHAGIPDLSKAKFIKDLPGSTGPKLYETPDGKQYVVKTGKSDDHLLNEATADRVYRALGVPTPNSGVTTMDGKLVKYSEFIHDAQTLQEWKAGKTTAEVKMMHEQLSKHFVADAVIANWDVIGMTNDNILIKNGVAYRADNGGALKYRAQGGLKGAKFAETVGELQTMRSSLNPSTSKIFGGVTDEQIKSQSLHILANKSKILDQISDTDTKQTMAKRIDSLFNVHKGAAPTSAATPSHGGSVPSGKHVVDKVKAAGIGMTSVQQLKLELLNPDGPVNGKLKIPLVLAAHMDAIAGQFPGVVIQKVDANKHLGDKLKQAKGGGLSAYQKEVKVVDKDTSLPVIAPAMTSKALPSTHGQSLMLHIGENLGSAKLTSIQLQKIGVLNPQGASSGVVKVPKNTQDSTMEHLAKILPPGTIIKKVNASGILGKTAQQQETGSAGFGAKKYSTADKDFSDTHISVGSVSSHPLQKQWEATLTTTEKAAISSWKGSARAYRKAFVKDPPPPPSKPENIQAKTFYTALMKAPKVIGVTWRGVDDDGVSNPYATNLIKTFQSLGEGGIWEEPAPHCSSRGKATAKDFANGHTIIQLHLKTGRLIENLGSHVNEKEVVGMPAKYKILKIHSSEEAKKLGVKHLVELEEM